MINKAKCYICKKTFSIEDFYKNKSRKDGYDFVCKVCKKKQMKEYHSSGKYKIAYKKWLKKNPHYSWSKATLKSHKKKDYIINIKPKELSEIAKIVKRCQICNCKLQWNQGNSDGKVKYNSPTLDRINNHRLIDKKEIQIICHKCNTTKSNRSMNDFVKYCKLIVNKFDIPKEALLVKPSNFRTQSL